MIFRRSVTVGKLRSYSTAPKGVNFSKIPLTNVYLSMCKKIVLLTVIILNIGTDRSEQTVQTQIRLLLKEQSDQGLLCLLFCLHLLNTMLHCKIQMFQL